MDRLTKNRILYLVLGFIVTVIVIGVRAYFREHAYINLKTARPEQCRDATVLVTTDPSIGPNGALPDTFVICSNNHVIWKRADQAITAFHVTFDEGAKPFKNHDPAGGPDEGDFDSPDGSDKPTGPAKKPCWLCVPPFDYQYYKYKLCITTAAGTTCQDPGGYVWK